MKSSSSQHCGCDCSWMNCSLCRAGREGINTLHRAQSRSIHWPQTQTSIRHIPRLEDPEIFTNIDDAFSSIFQFLQISTRKCGRYHHSHQPDPSDNTHHYLRYHTPNFQPSSVINPLTRSCDVHVQTIPGCYSVTATRDGTRGHRETTHHIKLEQGKAVMLTLDL